MYTISPNAITLTKNTESKNIRILNFFFQVTKEKKRQKKGKGEQRTDVTNGKQMIDFNLSKSIFG